MLKRKHVKTGRPRGRPKGPGSKVGRPKGSANKVASETRKRILKQAEEQGKMTPLEYVCNEMWNIDMPREYRLEAAKAALPYTSSKMPQITQLQGDANKPLVTKIEHSFEHPPDWDEPIERSEEDDTKPPLA